MNKIDKDFYAKKRKDEAINKCFNRAMIAVFIFMLVFAVQMCRKSNELQKQLTEQVK